jgi:hypothetical protein
MIDEIASPLAPADVAATRLPVDAARMLPSRVFHDPDVFAFEQSAWFGRDWLCVGRQEDADSVGSYFLASVAAANVVSSSCAGTTARSGRSRTCAGTAARSS